MLQIDHVYEFFFQTIFKDFTIYSLPNGVFKNKTIEEIKISDIHIFNCNYLESKIVGVELGVRMEVLIYVSMIWRG